MGNEHRIAKYTKSAAAIGQSLHADVEHRGVKLVESDSVLDVPHSDFCKVNMESSSDGKCYIAEKGCTWRTMFDAAHGECSIVEPPRCEQADADQVPPTTDAECHMTDLLGCECTLSPALNIGHRVPMVCAGS